MINDLVVDNNYSSIMANTYERMTLSSPILSKWIKVILYFNKLSILQITLTRLGLKTVFFYFIAKIDINDDDIDDDKSDDDNNNDEYNDDDFDDSKYNHYDDDVSKDGKI